MIEFTGLKIQKKEIVLPNGKNIAFNQDIGDCIIIECWLIIRLEIPMGDDTVNNIYGINIITGELWRIQSLHTPVEHPYIAIIFDKSKEKLFAVNFYGIRVQIDILDGSITNRDFVK